MMSVIYLPHCTASCFLNTNKLYPWASPLQSIYHNVALYTERRANLIVLVSCVLPLNRTYTSSLFGFSREDKDILTDLKYSTNRPEKRIHQTHPGRQISITGAGALTTQKQLHYGGVGGVVP